MSGISSLEFLPRISHAAVADLWDAASRSMARATEGPQWRGGSRLRLQLTSSEFFPRIKNATVTQAESIAHDSSFAQGF